jgi:hypothetical protein
MYVCIGLIGEKDIDAAHLHIQKSLQDMDLLDPSTNEIMEDPAVSNKKESAKKLKRGFIVSLDGETFIVDKEDFSSGKAVGFCNDDVLYV